MSDILPETEKVAQGITAAAERHIKLMEKAWGAAVKATLAYFVVYLKYHVGTTDVDLLDPDVSKRLDKAAASARDAAIPVLEKSAINGSLLGYREAAAAYKALGLPMDEKFEYKPGDLLKSFHADLQQIQKDFSKGVISALEKEDEDALKAAFRRYSMRAQMVTEASTKMHAYRALIHYMQGTDTKAEWVTTSPHPCSYCDLLHGQTRDWGKPFKVDGFPVYGKILYGPQLHPNCACRLVVQVP
jgi:hypothetical protein